jgi:hypothetical protein
VQTKSKLFLILLCLVPLPAWSADCTPPDPPCPPAGGACPPASTFGSLGILVNTIPAYDRSKGAVTINPWSAYGPWGDKCGLFGWIRARSRSRGSSWAQTTRCTLTCVYRQPLVGGYIDTIGVVSFPGVAQTCSESEIDYDYAFFDPPPGLPPPGVLPLDDPSCPTVYSFGTMTFDWTFVDTDPTVAAHSATYRGLSVVDGANVSVGDTAGLQNTTLHVTYDDSSADDWVFQFTATGPLSFSAPAPVTLPVGQSAEVVVPMRNNLLTTTTPTLSVTQPTGWEVRLATDNGGELQAGQQASVRLVVRPLPSSQPNHSLIQLTAISTQGKTTSLSLPVTAITAAAAPALSAWALTLLVSAVLGVALMTLLRRR